MSTFQVLQHVFVISDPYKEGHVLSAAEARALNMIRARRIKRQLDWHIRRVVKSRNVSPEVVKTLQLRAAEIDEKFNWDRQRDSEPLTGLQAEALRVAQELEPEASPERLAELASLPSTLEEADRRMEVAREVAQQALNELTA